MHWECELGQSKSTKCYSILAGSKNDLSSTFLAKIVSFPLPSQWLHETFESPSFLWTNSPRKRIALLVKKDSA